MGPPRGFGPALHRSRSPPRDNRRDASPPRRRSADRRGFSAERQHRTFSAEQYGLAARERIEEAQSTLTGRADLVTAEGVIFQIKITSQEGIEAWVKDATQRGELHHKMRIACLMADLDQCALFFPIRALSFPARAWSPGRMSPISAILGILRCFPSFSSLLQVSRI